MIKILGEAVTAAAYGTVQPDSPPAHAQALALTAMAAALLEQGYGQDVLGRLVDAARTHDPAMVALGAMVVAESASLLRAV